MNVAQVDEAAQVLHAAPGEDGTGACLGGEEKKELFLILKKSTTIYLFW